MVFFATEGGLSGTRLASEIDDWQLYAEVRDSALVIQPLMQKVKHIQLRRANGQPNVP